MTMTQKEFFWWLKGYLHGETYLSSTNLEEIKEQMTKVSEPVQPFVNSSTWGGSGTITLPCNNSTTLTVPVTPPELLND